ncbi:hypothetical protein Gasu2_59900 [Galdieria sulphuraria]|uniref:RRM domain-containing protein n=1 Tax=Galdieria sulphuraria TaxID=130081 RepID=M2X9A6_GALSU|nr:uncharacterized protein Gasu_59540 [Galdieria sulphuraria]EME26392.1 hypothetical protein Gasu_59540 [Galdieria sulphuraria]GJD11865.1 hypothetical protein Gasu2_59900 [Galdieria sulphuraria]|eukprot:XP_005702912.1 hypothetical protein Gasu_59540 [Galdieria sulphuraria]
MAFRTCTLRCKDSLLHMVEASTQLQEKLSVSGFLVLQSFSKQHLPMYTPSCRLSSSSNGKESQVKTTPILKNSLFRQNFIPKEQQQLNTKAQLRVLRMDRVPLSANHSDIELLCTLVEPHKPQWLCRLMLDRVSPYATWCVVFETEEAALEAEKVISTQSIAGSALHCFRISTAAVEKAVASTAFSMEERPRVVILSNLPYPLSEYHILQLFRDYQVERLISSRVPSMAYLVFASFDEACRACREKQNEYLGWKKIRLTPVV